MPTLRTYDHKTLTVDVYSTGIVSICKWDKITGALIGEVEMSRLEWLEVVSSSVDVSASKALWKKQMQRGEEVARHENGDY
jgi:hypothetical protein